MTAQRERRLDWGSHSPFGGASGTRVARGRVRKRFEEAFSSFGKFEHAFELELVYVCRG